MSTPSKIKVALLCGGRSPEHEVSLVSAVGVLNQISRDKYSVIPVRISHEGRWFMLDAAKSYTSSGDLENAEGIPVLLGDPEIRGLVPIQREGRIEPIPVDVLFPILHGPFGEDGTLQGLAAMADIPCAGPGVLGAAAGMDKVIMKQLFIQNDMETPDFIWFLRSSWQREPDAIIRGVKAAVGYPCFVKPANAGSSVGITKVKSEKDLKPAIELACEYDRKVLVEKCIHARELECAVLGNDRPEASPVGEILPCNEFYDYNAKYLDDKSEIIIPAEIPDDVTDRIRFRAIAAFKAMDCSGLARVDFLFENGTNHIFINEINTIPGFTPISMYPKLWEAAGISYMELIDRLIQLALERHKDIHQSKFFR